MNDPTPSYYVAASLVGTVLIYKMFWAKPSRELRWGVYAMLITVFCIEFFAAPATIGVINRLTGVDNFSALFVYGLVVVVAVLQLLLIVYWQRPLADARRLARRWLTFYGLALLALLALFIAGRDRVPVERRVDFDTYYATTPIISAFILLYLLVFSISPVAVIWMSFRWAKVAGRPWLRRGLRCIGYSQISALIFVVAKLAAVFARMSGENLDFLSSQVAPACASMATILYAVGWTLPTWGERITGFLGRMRRWRDYRALRPLWHALTTAEPRVLQGGELPRFALEERITRRCKEIRDAQLALLTRFDPILAQEATHVAELAGLQGRERDAMIDAIRLDGAVKAKAQDRRYAEPEPREVHHSGADGLDELEYLAMVARRFSVTTLMEVAR